MEALACCCSLNSFFLFRLVENLLNLLLNYVIDTAAAVAGHVDTVRIGSNFSKIINRQAADGIDDTLVRADALEGYALRIKDADFVIPVKTSEAFIKAQIKELIG